MPMQGLRELVWLTELGLSIVSPLVLCVLGAAWLRGRFSLEPWIVIIGLLVGLGGAFSAGLAFYRHTRLMDKKPGKKDPPVYFNEHQ